MKFDGFRNRRKWSLFGVTALVAFAVRVILFTSWLHSPLRFFHRIAGLDMMTLLHFAEWGGEGTVLFAPHRMLAALLWNLNGGVHSIVALVVIQLFLGTAVAVMAAYVALHLWGDRRAALIAGLVAGFYAPAAMYELTMLQETLALFTFTASFAGLLWARNHQFRSWYGVAAGGLLGLASIGRPTALLWVFAALGWSGYLLWRRGRLKRVLLPVIGVLGVWILISSLNWGFARYPGPFYHVFAYSTTVNTAPAASGLDSGKKTEQGFSAASATASFPEKLARIGWNAVGRIPHVFLAHEVPNNMNYYFIREYFPELKLMIGPTLLIPFALAGLGLILLSLRVLRRDGIIFWAVVTLVLPICANYPYGRYRLILLVPFALLAVEAVRIGLSKPRWIMLPVSVSVLAGAFLLNPVHPGNQFRSSDFVSWALALEQPSGKPNPDSLATLAAGYRLSGKQAPAINLLIRLISMREYDAAEQLIADALARGIVNRSLFRYYAAMLRLQRGDVAGAETHLEKVDPSQLGNLVIKYDFLCGEVARRKGDPVTARRYFRRALAEPDPFGFRPMVENGLRKLDASLPVRGGAK